MINLKESRFKICKCEKCHAEFLPNSHDTFEYIFTCLDTFETFIKCPHCGHYVPVENNTKN